VLIIPNNNSFRNHHCSLLPNYCPAVSTTTTTTIAVCMTYCIEHPSPSSRWWKVRFKLEQATKAKWTSICIYVYIYILSLTLDLDAVKLSTPRNGCSNLKKGTWYPIQDGRWSRKFGCSWWYTRELFSISSNFWNSYFPPFTYIIRQQFRQT